MSHRTPIFNLLNNELFGQNNILRYFDSKLFGSGDDLGEFHPDVSGYTLIFLMPPHLSGYLFGEGYVEPLNRYVKAMCFLALDFTPPMIQVTASELPSRSGSLPFGMEVTPTGQVNIAYIEDQYNHIFGFHKLWISYIEDILRGVTTAGNAEMKPNQAYWDPEYSDPQLGNRFGQIDYVTTAYVIRFKPTRYLTPHDINYVGKATGMFPITLPDKEIIGRRDSNELVTLSVSYSCTWYRSWSAGTPGGDHDKYIYDEFAKIIGSVYEQDIAVIT